MSKKRTKLISIIAIFTIVGGLLSILGSIPLFPLYTSVLQGGITIRDKVSIQQVRPDTPAAEAKLKEGDIIITVNGKKITKPEEFKDITTDNQGEVIEITYEREGRIQTAQLTPRINPSPGEGRVGIMLTRGVVEKKPLYELIPYVIMQSYAGYEENSFLFLYSNTYKDKSYSRLQSLILGVVSLIIGIGLWKLRKWALYGLLLLTFLNLIFAIPYLLNPANYALSEGYSILISKPTPGYMIFYIISLVIEIFFAIYIYKQRRIFQ